MNISFTLSDLVFLITISWIVFCVIYIIVLSVMMIIRRYDDYKRKKVNKKVMKHILKINPYLKKKKY